MAEASLEIRPGIWVDEDELSEQFIRSSGPGGQNVNKVATAVQLRFNVANARHLPDHVRVQALKLAGSRATKEGEVVIEAGRFRTQEQNRQDARTRLVELLFKASEPPPKPRRKTRPTKGSVERRLKEKTGRGQIKKMRGKVTGD